jgi:hypothetical protein
MAIDESCKSHCSKYLKELEVPAATHPLPNELFYKPYSHKPTAQATNTLGAPQLEVVSKHEGNK